MTEKGQNIPDNAVRPADNAIVLPGGSYDFLALEKALGKVVDKDDEHDRHIAINEVLVDQQQNDPRDSVPLPPGHRIVLVEDAQGNKVQAAVPILEKGEAVEPEPAVPPVPPVTPTTGADGDTKPKTGAANKS